PVQFHPLSPYRNASVGPCQREQIGDKLRQALCLSARLAERFLAISLSHLRVSLDQLEVSLDGGEWCPQFVRSVGNELLLRLVRLVEADEHRVEDMRQAAELVVTRGLGHAALEVPRTRDTRRGVCKGADRP